MDAFRDESSQRLQELAADLDMMLPSRGLADPSREEDINQTLLDTVEEQQLGLVDMTPQGSVNLPARPPMRREGSVPAPSQPPPPAPPQMAESSSNSADSLSLIQLQSLVREMPKIAPTPYAFVFRDAASLPEELEEWFAYTTQERANILRAQSCFATEWGAFNDWSFSGDEESALDWNKTPTFKRKHFMQKLVQGLQESDIEKRLEQLEALVYLVLGCWHETAGLEAGNLTLEEASNLLGKGKGKGRAVESDDIAPPCEQSEQEAPRDKAIELLYSKSGFQIQWLKTNIKMLFEINGIQPIFDIVQAACLREW